MDPTLADTLRRYLAQVDVDHAANGAVCACGARMTSGRASHLLDVIAEATIPAATAPRVVHVATSFSKIDGNGRQYVGPTDCPDCTKGLTSRGVDMICPRLSRTTTLRGCHDGCVIACGVVPHG